MGKSLISHTEHESEAVTHTIAPSAGASGTPSNTRHLDRLAGGFVASPAQACTGSALMSCAQEPQQVVRDFLEVSARFLDVGTDELAGLNESNPTERKAS